MRKHLEEEGMNLSTRKRGSVTIITVEAPERLVMPDSLGFRAALLEKCKGEGQYVLNLEKVANIDSTGLTAIIGLRREVEKCGGSLRLAGLRPAVRMVFKLTRLFDVFVISDDIDAALEAVAA